MHRASVRQASHTGKAEQGKIKCRTCELKHKDELKEQLFIDCLQILKKKKKAKQTRTHPVHKDSQSCIRFTSVRRLLNCTKKKLFTKQTFILRMITHRGLRTRTSTRQMNSSVIHFVVSQHTFTVRFEGILGNRQASVGLTVPLQVFV